MSDIKAKLIALVDNYTDPLSVKDIHKADFAEKFTDHLLASSPIQELWNEAYDLGVDFALHNHFGLSWEDAAGLRKEITRLQEATKWIPVTERLPEENTAVMTYRESGIQVEFRWYKGWDNDEFTPCQVTHWMPLPAAPEEV
ncbi:MAG: DUF551 domain-containing protein [Oscillospiraceae bacterium]|nr:DUF551 domain-containing protein [Oscillospiraceae bacterium]